MEMLSIFHTFAMPFLLGLSLTLLKVIADQKDMTWDEANDIALDMALLGAGAIGAFSIKGGTSEQFRDAAIGDLFLSVILLFLRYRRSRLTRSGAGPVPPVGPIMGLSQLALGLAAIFWTIRAF